VDAPKPPRNDPAQTFGYIDRGRLMVLLNREDYWQCAFVIPKGATAEIRQRGLPAFREQIASPRPVPARIASMNSATGKTSACSP